VLKYSIFFFLVNRVRDIFSFLEKKENGDTRKWGGVWWLYGNEATAFHLHIPSWWFQEGGEVRIGGSQKV